MTREEADGSEIVTCWIPLTDVTAETGCLKLIPDKTHLGLSVPSAPWRRASTTCAPARG